MQNAFPGSVDGAIGVQSPARCSLAFVLPGERVESGTRLDERARRCLRGVKQGERVFVRDLHVEHQSFEVRVRQHHREGVGLAAGAAIDRLALTLNALRQQLHEPVERRVRGWYYPGPRQETD